MTLPSAGKQKLLEGRAAESMDQTEHNQSRNCSRMLDFPKVNHNKDANGKRAKVVNQVSMRFSSHLCDGLWVSRQKNRGSILGSGKRFSTAESRPALGSSFLSNGHRGDLPFRVKQPGREVGHAFPSSTVFKKKWVYTSIPPYFFMAWCLLN